MHPCCLICIHALTPNIWLKKKKREERKRRFRICTRLPVSSGMLGVCVMCTVGPAVVQTKWLGLVGGLRRAQWPLCVAEVSLVSMTASNWDWQIQNGAARSPAGDCHALSGGILIPFSLMDGGNGGGGGLPNLMAFYLHVRGGKIGGAAVSLKSSSVHREMLTSSESSGSDRNMEMLEFIETSEGI